LWTERNQILFGGMIIVEINNIELNKMFSNAKNNAFGAEGGGDLSGFKKDEPEHDDGYKM
jgi:hypothetical protein